MDTQTALREAISEHNLDFKIRAWAAVGVGVLTSFALFGLLVLVFFGIVMTKHWLLYATLVFLIFTLAGAWSARRGDDPASVVTTFSDHEALSRAAGWQLTGWPVDVAGGAAGVSTLAMHGPYCVIEGLSMLRCCLPKDDPVIRDAARLLKLLGEEKSVPVEEANPPRIALLLLRLGLAKPDRKNPKPPSVVITEKGRDVLSGRHRAGPS